MRRSLRQAYNTLRYRWLARSAPVHRLHRDELVAAGYFSQCGQDKWVVEVLLPGVTGGVFVDIGAHDGVTLSNTLFLEAQLGWRGLLVEPNPEVFQKLVKNRSGIPIHGCVAASPGKAKFQMISGYSEMLSGLLTHYDPRHLDRIRREIATHGGAYREIEVDCFRLDELLLQHGFTEVDYLSIDVENAELAILKTLDFQRFRIKVIGVENAYNDYRIPLLLKRNGYRFHSKVGDEFFVRE